MTFDPFGDFVTRGYLRNYSGEKDPDIVRRLEHTSLVTGIDDAFAHLAATQRIPMQMCSALTESCSKLFILGPGKTEW